MLHCNFRSLPRDALRSFGSNFTRFTHRPLGADGNHEVQGDPGVRRIGGDGCGSTGGDSSHSDGRRCARGSLRAKFTLRAGFTPLTLGSCRTLRAAFATLALGPCRTDGALFSLWSGTAAISLESLRAGLTRKPLLTLRSLFSLRAAVARNASFPPGADWASRSRITLRPYGAAVAFGAHGAGIPAVRYLLCLLLAPYRPEYPEAPGVPEGPPFLLGPWDRDSPAHPLAPGDHALRGGRVHPGARVRPAAHVHLGGRVHRREWGKNTDRRSLCQVQSRNDVLYLNCCWENNSSH